LLFCIFSNFSDSIKLKKFSDFFSGIIKWVIGLSVTVISLFITVNGIAGAGFDGITIKTAKYAIANSIPMIGGFLRDGVDLVVAGSILIKNAIGVATLIYVFYGLLSPVLQIISFSFVVRLATSLIEPVADNKITDFCSSISRSAGLLLVCLLFTVFLFVLVLILIVLTSNCFI
jgi:stage III sporulation protein AE